MMNVLLRKETLTGAAALVAASLTLAACGSSHKTTTTTTTTTKTATTAKTTTTTASAVLNGAGSGAVTGSNHVNTTASVPSGTPGIDAIYAPPDSAVAAEDAANGEVGALAVNGTPSATAASDAERRQLGLNYAIPTDQNFSVQWFAGDSPWNTNVENIQTDPHSDTLIRRAETRIDVTQNALGVERQVTTRDDAPLFINTVAWTDPVVQGGPLTAVHCRQSPDCGDDGNNKIKALQIPSNVNPNPYYDGWFTVISPNGHWAYDMFRARRLSNGSVSFQYMRIWDLQGAGYGQASFPSARGSGLPLFGGLIRPAELKAGQINHALAISVPGPASTWYVPPASTTDGIGATNSLPEGARLRLKGNITIPKNSKTFHLTTQQRVYVSALLATLRNYGAIVVDRAAVPTLYGQEGVTAPLLSGNELSFLKLDNFQVVQMPQERQYPAPSNKLTGLAAQISSTGGGF